MLDHLALTPELFIQGIAAVFLILWAWRDAAKARRDAAKAIAPNPMVAAMSMSWDRDQQERLLQIMERMAKALEAQAHYQKEIDKAQGIMVDQRQNEFSEKIDELLDRIRRGPMGSVRRRRARVLIAKAKEAQERPPEEE